MEQFAVSRRRRSVEETEDDLRVIQDLMDRSHDAAGPHLREVITPERRLTAREVRDRLTGMRLLALATATADGRPLVGPVDGIFYRGAFHFGSAPDSVRIRHIRRRPQVSATHLPGEELSVTVHGRAAVRRRVGGVPRRQRLRLDRRRPHVHLPPGVIPLLGGRPMTCPTTGRCPAGADRI